MRKDLHAIERWKMAGDADSDGGIWMILFDGVMYQVIASWGGGWDHVSVVLPRARRCATWQEMQWLRNLFFEDDEVVVQYHPRKAQHKNLHPYCLHLWRPQNQEIPTPPVEFV